MRKPDLRFETLSLPVCITGWMGETTIGEYSVQVANTVGLSLTIIVSIIYKLEGYVFPEE